MKKRGYAVSLIVRDIERKTKSPKRTHSQQNLKRNAYIIKNGNRQQCTFKVVTGRNGKFKLISKVQGQ